MKRRALLVSLSVGALLPITATQAVGHHALAQRVEIVDAVQHTYPAGFSKEDPAREMRPVAPPESFIADNDSVADQLAFARAASALPVANPSKSYKSLGPYGLDMPPGYSQSGERFARVAGMGAAAAVDVRDPSGKTIYIGGMGGAWRSTDAGAHWINLTDGKLPRSAVGAIALDPRHPGDLYVGSGIGRATLSGDSQGTGIYVSHNYGKTFTRPTSNVKGYAVTSIVPISSGVVVGTTHGLYVSSNRGGSFTEVLLKTNAAHTAHQVGAYANWISSIAANPLRGGDVTIAVGAAYGKRKLSDGTIVAPGNGLYRSVNGVKGPFTYLPSSSGLSNPLSSNDPIGRISLTYGPTTGQGNALWALVSDAGLLNGSQPGGLDIISQTTGESLNVANTVLNGLYRSGDNGLTWTVKATPQSLTAAPNSTVATISGLGYGAGVQAFYNNWVVADPAAPDHVFIGLEEVYQTIANAGPTPGLAQTAVIQRYADVCGFLTYTQNVTNGSSCPDGVPLYSGQATHPDQQVGVVARTANGVRLYTGNDGGFFRQDSHAGAIGGFDNSSWKDMNTIATTQPYHVARKTDGEIVFGFQDNGGGFFAPGGRAITTSGGDGVLAIATHDPDVWYTSSQGAAFYITKDHGHTITEIQPDLKSPVFTSPIIMDPTDENHLIAAAGDIQESLLGPKTTTLFDPVAGTVVSTSWAQSFDLGASGVVNNGNPVNWTTQALAARGTSIYAAICGLCRNSVGNSLLIKTGIATNVKAGCKAAKGTSLCWHIAAGKGLPKVAIQELVINPQDVRTIYVVLNENSLVGLNRKLNGNQRVMVSHDRGESFSDLSGNLPRSNMRDVIVRNGQVIVAGDNGIFTAKAGSNSWSRLANGLPQTRVYDLNLDPTGRYLTIAVYGRGVWQYDFGTAATHSSSGPGAQGEATVPVSGERPAIPVGMLTMLALLGLVALSGGWKIRALRLQPMPLRGLA